MTEIKDSPGSRVLNISGNVHGKNVVMAGDGNVVGVHESHEGTVDLSEVRAAIDGLREILAGIETPDRKKIINAVEEAGEELTKPEPDKNEVGRALDRAMEYTQKTEKFVSIIDKLKPHVTAVSAWLGTNWPHIARCLGG